MNREIVIRYGNTIDRISSEIRKALSGSNTAPVGDELLRITENIFFSSMKAGEVDIGDLRGVIMSIFKRVGSKYGVLAELLDDDRINEIMVNGPRMIYVERNRRVEQIDDAFTSDDELENIIRMFASDVHREVNEANPIVDARLSSGYRVNGVLKNVALNGPILTIRKFSDKEITMNDLINLGSITTECSNFLCSLVRSGYNIFISGGTSSGKTTFLNALSAAIDPAERAIVIEDSSELKIDHLKNIVHMECRSANSIGKGEVNMEKLIRTSLRMRPDRIIVGEVRGKEVVDMIQAMNTGHSGSMSTGHGNSIMGMLNRLETMYLMDAEIPLYSIRNQIASAIEIFIHLMRDSSGKRRVVEIAEMLGADEEGYKLNYLFKSDSKGDLRSTGNDLINDEKLVRGYN